MSCDCGNCICTRVTEVLLLYFPTVCGCVSTDPVCMADTGQCNCPAGVTGRTCDQCAEFNFGYNSTNGCTVSRVCVGGGGVRACMYVH